MALLSVVSGVLLIIGPTVPLPAVLMIGVVGLMSGLLMARPIGVVGGRWKREAAAATVLLVACLFALILASQHNGHCVRVLALGALLAILARNGPRPHRRDSGIPPDIRRAVWVTGETAAVGSVQPALTFVVLVMLGPAASVGFRVVSTISGALEPIIAYGRFRLLAHGHKGEFAPVYHHFRCRVGGGSWSRLVGCLEPDLRSRLEPRDSCWPAPCVPVESTHAVLYRTVRRSQEGG